MKNRAAERPVTPDENSDRRCVKGIKKTVRFQLIILFSVVLAQISGPAGVMPERARATVQKPELVEAFLYFADPASAHLKAVHTSFPYGMADHELGMAMLDALMAGPGVSGFSRIFPETTRVNALFITEGGAAYVDLGVEGPAFEDAIGEYLGIYSLVNTLAVNIPAVRQVKILVNGSDNGVLGNHLSLSSFFTTNMRIVK